MHERNVAIRNGKETVNFVDKGAGRDLVYIPGVFGLTWDPFLDSLSDHHRVIALDLPGTGRSTGDDEILNIHDLLYYLLDFLDTLQVRDAILVGHSLGGMIAAELAAVQPQRFRKVVLIAPMGLWNESYKNDDFFLYREMREELTARLFHDPSSVPAPPPPANDEEKRAAIVDRAKHLTVAAKYLWPIPDKGLKKRAHRIASPTLLLWGTSDRFTSHQYAEDFVQLLPNATVRLFDRSGHLPQLEQRDDVITAVSEFLAI